MREVAIATRLRWYAISLLALLPCLFCSKAAAGDTRPPTHLSPTRGGREDSPRALPRYRLEVGQELVYRLMKQEEFREANGTHEPGSDAPRDQMEWRVFVVRKNADGSWRLYIRTKIALVNRNGVVRRKWDSLGLCDLQPDGAYSLDEQTAVFDRLMPYELFCRLPPAAAALEEGWKFANPVDGRLLTYRLGQRDGEAWQIAGIQHGDYGEIQKTQTSFKYDFDMQRGLVASIANEFKDLATSRVLGRRTYRLISSELRDSAWIARFHEEANKYLDVHSKWMTLCYEGLRAHSVEACKTSRSKARVLLVAGREQARLDVLRELYDATIKTHDNDEWMLDSVKKREEFFAAVPEFPMNWEAKNLDGSTFRLADQRGKVLVLFLWETGCEYNVLAGTQMRRLAVEYQGKKDVALVGMLMRRASKDEEAKVKYLIAKTYRGFPHAEGNNIRTLYPLQKYEMGFSPSILILDQAGRVHEVFAGYSGDLAQRIRKVVDDLRSKPPVKKE